MIVDLREIYLNNLNYYEFGALLSLYCIEHNIESDFQTITFNQSLYTVLEGRKLIKLFNKKPFLRVKGKELIEQLVNFKEKSKWTRKPVKTPFEEFWETFPTSDSHGVFTKTRNLKSNKSGCKKKYEQYLNKGIKHEDIIKALKYEINEKKEKSIRDNKLSYLKNSYTWLNQKEFEIILESMEENDNNESGTDWTDTVV